jgi:hypothetical protein
LLKLSLVSCLDLRRVELLERGSLMSRLTRMVIAHLSMDRFESKIRVIMDYVVIVLKGRPMAFDLNPSNHVFVTPAVHIDRCHPHSVITPDFDVPYATSDKDDVNVCPMSFIYIIVVMIGDGEGRRKIDGLSIDDRRLLHVLLRRRLPRIFLGRRGVNRSDHRPVRIVAPFGAST